MPTGTSEPARCCPIRCSRSCVARMPSCSGQWVPRSARPRSLPARWSGGSCSVSGSSWTCTSTCGPFTGVPGALAPDCDFVVIRENTEGTYAGEGGFLRKGTPFEVATQGSVNTRHGVERCARFAFDLASTRPRHHLTLVHKTNVLTFAGDLWQRTVDEVSVDYPAVEPRLQPCRRHLHLPGREPRPLRRHRHRQPVRRHHHRPGRCRGRRDRLRRLGQPQSRSYRAVPVRAGPRGGP